VSGGRADEDGESTGQLGSDREGRGLKRRSLDEGTTTSTEGDGEALGTAWCAGAERCKYCKVEWGLLKPVCQR